MSMKLVDRRIFEAYKRAVHSALQSAEISVDERHFILVAIEENFCDYTGDLPEDEFSSLVGYGRTPESQSKALGNTSTIPYHVRPTRWSKGSKKA